jgi:hypothetical protein
VQERFCLEQEKQQIAKEKRYCSLRGIFFALMPSLFTGFGMWQHSVTGFAFLFGLFTPRAQSVNKFQNGESPR